MKIIAVSNHNDERISDVLICEGITNQKIGTEIKDFLNNLYSNDNFSTYYFMLVEDDRKLHEFKP